MNDTLKSEFLKACGGTGPLRLIVERAGGLSEHCLTQPFALIGRHPRADLCFDDARLAQRHAYIQMLAGRVLFVNFMYHVEGQQTGWLDPGDTLEIGPLRIRLPDDSSLPDWCQSDGEHRFPMHDIHTVHFDVEARSIHSTWRMKRPIAIIGNSAACKVRLYDRTVSRFHCSLINTPTGLFAIDLLSTRGLKVDSQPSVLAKLADRSRLVVGEFALIMQPRQNALDIGKAENADARSNDQHKLQTHAAAAIVPTAADLALADDSDSFELAGSSMVMELARMQQNMMAQMQQQMADQFQQAMGFFVEAFWSMHREQSKVVQRELRRIRALTRELKAIQAELAKSTAESRTSATPHFTLNLANAVTAAPSPPAIAPVEKGPSPALRPAAEPAGTPAHTKEPTRPLASDSPARPPQRPTPTPAEPPPSKAAASPPSVTTSPPPAGAQSPANMHAWLNQRVVQIQRQRQSSWQRLLSVIQGKSAGNKPQASP